MTSDRDDAKSAPSLEPRVQAHLGEQLRQFYGSILAEPVPDRFKSLLDQLERASPPEDHPEETDR